MSAPDPDDEPSALRRLIREGGRVRPLEERERVELLARMNQRLGQKPPKVTTRRLAVAAFVCTALLGLTLLTSESPEAPSQRASTAPPPAVERPGTEQRDADAGTSPTNDAVRRVSLAGRGEIVLETGAIARLPDKLQAHARGPVQVALDRGKLTATVAPRGRDEPLSIVTPQVAVVVVGTRFSVTVDDDLTTVQVAEGRVRVERGGQSLFVDGGQGLRSDDPRFSDGASLAPAQVQCDDEKQRRRCLRRVARGTDLAAENALFALALLEHDERGEHDAALTHLQNYERRFPRGRLRQEVALTIVRIHHELGHRAQACALGGQYVQRFDADVAVRARLRADCEPPAAAR